MRIRSEDARDITAIRDLTSAAFEGAEHSTGSEGAIIDALRLAGALSVSLVAVDGDEIIGHVAFSPVGIGGASLEWYGLGPVSVRPDRQRQGVGEALIREGLFELRHRGAQGCVVLGDPSYYGRFGFRHDPDLELAGVPKEYFQRLAFGRNSARGEVSYHPAFSVSS